jgi:DNA-binding CsgD family transcriptional regulator
MSRHDPIGELYDAAFEDDGLQRMATILVREAHAGTACVTPVNDLRLGIGTHGLPQECGESYVAYYAKINPCPHVVDAFNPAPALRAVRAAEMVPELVYRQSEFFVDFARRYDTFEEMGGPIPLAPGLFGDWCVHRGRHNKRFDERDRDRLEQLLPHLQRALQLRRRLGTIEGSRIGLAALDALAIGVVVCDGAGAILFANAAAEAHARSGDGLVLGGAGQGVAAFYPGESALLRSLIVDAACGGPGGAVAITGYERGKLFMLVAPLPARIADEPGRVLVTMRPAAAGPTFDAFTLQRLFGLTQAEARLALALLAGSSLAEFGAERHVTENTLRTQLAHVLRKTETGSQRELVRLLSLLPPLR